jgi:3-oxoadipate enol-lactonase
MTTPLQVNWEYEPKQANVVVDPGVSLTYETLGEGPAITAVNSAFLIAPMWRSFTQQIAQRNRVITYDMRNQGASGGDPDATWAQHVDDLGHVLDAARAERTYLVTSSASALICRDFALAHPDRVAGLILLGPALSPHGGSRRKAINKTWLTTLEKVGADALWDQLWSLTLSPAGIEAQGPAAYVALREAFVAMMESPALLANLRTAMEADDDPELLKRISCPTLLIVGDCDFMVGPSDLQKLAELIPDCETLYLPQVGHLPYWEATADFERATIEFIDRVEGL